MMMRTDGTVLVARKGHEYYFIDSVFEHDDDFRGCTGTVACPVSEDYLEELLSDHCLTDRYVDHYEEKYAEHALDDCPECNGMVDDEGCEYCDYPSLASLCDDIRQYDGVEAVIDNLNSDYVEAMGDYEDDIEYAECIGCGRIFGNMSPDDFDEVYNLKALLACLAYEDNAVSYNYAVAMIFGGIN